MSEHFDRESVSDQIAAAYTLIHKGYFGSIRREDMAKLLAHLLPAYIEELFPRYSARMGMGSARTQLMGRYYYMRAAILHLSGDTRRAREYYAQARRVLISSDEKELCDNLRGLGVD